MKRFFTPLFFLISTIAYGQKINIDTVRWVSDNLGHIAFYKEGVSFDFDGHIDSKGFRLEKDTIVMVDSYTTSADNFKIRHTDLFKFLIKNMDARTLTVSPFDDNAKKLVKRDFYTFYNLSYMQDSDIKFSKLKFFAGACYGRCPTMDMEVDSAGNFKVNGAGDPYRNAGSLTGKLTKTEIETLTYLLQHSQLKKMHNWKQTSVVHDAPPYRFSIVYDNKNLEIETNDPPLNIQDLINFFLPFYNRIPLIVKPVTIKR